MVFAVVGWFGERAPFDVVPHYVGHLPFDKLRTWLRVLSWDPVWVWPEASKFSMLSRPQAV